MNLSDISKQNQLNLMQANIGIVSCCLEFQLHSKTDLNSHKAIPQSGEELPEHFIQDY